MTDLGTFAVCMLLMLFNLALAYYLRDNCWWKAYRVVIFTSGALCATGIGVILRGITW